MTAVVSAPQTGSRPATNQTAQVVAKQSVIPQAVALPETIAAAEPQAHEVAKPLIQDLSWLDDSEDDEAEGPAIYVTSYYEPVAGPSTAGGGAYPANAGPAFDGYAPNSGFQPTFQQAAYEQPAAQFAGGPIPLETPGMEPLPPLNPNAPPPGFEPPSVVLKRPPLRERIWGEIRSDYANFYSCQSLAILGVGFGIGAVMANTSIDQHLRDNYHAHIGDSAKKAIHHFHPLGSGNLVIPVMAVSTLAEVFWPDTLLGDTVGVWGENSMRALLVGGPPLLLMQRVTGGSRPGENPWGSHWRFFKDSNGVSGDAFIGGVAFITAAKMTDNYLLKTGFYALSVMPALGRINDDAHYPSQAFLGYFLAYMACTAVDLTNYESEHVAIVPLVGENTSGIGIQFTR